MTDLQRRALGEAVRRTRRGEWLRSGELAQLTGQHVRGAAVTLASLHTKGLLTHRAWRGKDGEANAAYEYQASPAVLEELRRAFAK